MATEDSDDSDEWGQEELAFPAPKEGNRELTKEEKGVEQVDDEDYWAPSETSPSPTRNKVEEKKDDCPMIIVDMTQMTCEKIHSKFDRNSVNDGEAVSRLRKQIEKDYETHASNATLLGNGTVIPCGASVWKDALCRLRDERIGHYFAPIFPPKT